MFDRQNRIQQRDRLVHSKIRSATPKFFVFEKEIHGGLRFDSVVFENIHCNVALAPEVQLAGGY